MNGAVCEGPTDEPDAVVTGDAPGFYHLVVDRDVGAVSVRGDADALAALLETLPPTIALARRLADRRRRVGRTRSRYMPAGRSIAKTSFAARPKAEPSK